MSLVLIKAYPNPVLSPPKFNLFLHQLYRINQQGVRLNVKLTGINVFGLYTGCPKKHDIDFPIIHGKSSV